MSKAVITTVVKGEFYELLEDKYTGPLRKAYAKKIGADYCVLKGSQHSQFNEEFYNKRSPAWLKLCTGELLKSGGYSVGIYIDCDVLINPKAPNILDYVRTGRFGLMDESAFCERDGVVEKFIATNCYRMARATWDYYYNTGVMVIGSELSGYIAPPYDFQVKETDPWLDQTYINYCIQKLGIKYVDPLPPQFNWMSCHHYDIAEKRQAGYFVHYAGMSGKIHKMLDYIEQDLTAWGVL